MKKTEKNLLTITSIFVVSLIIANVVAGKVVNIFGLTVPAAVVAYAITFTCTDVVGEIWGKEKANQIVKIGFISQLVALLLIFLAIRLPPAVFAKEFSKQFSSVLGQSARVVVASLSAYLISQFNDVFVFHKLKTLCKNKHKWIRNNLSTATSQLIDTAIFITIAFYNVVPDLWWMIISQYIVKLILALLDTPVFYYLTRNNNAKTNNVSND